MTAGLLIDPFRRVVEDIEFPADTAATKALIGARDLDHAVLHRAADWMLCGFCDGEGYYRPEQAWARLAFYPDPLAGRAVLYAAGERGETIDVPFKARQLQPDVIWLDARPTLPPMTTTINGVERTVVDFNAPDAPTSREEAFARLFGGTPGGRP
jgi:hypothetical protein